MPFCPECRVEYGVDVRQCPDCNVGLVDALPDTSGAPDRSAAPGGEPRDLEQVVLCTVMGEIHAKLLQDVLETEGVRVRLQFGWPFDGLVHVLKPPPPFGSPVNSPVRVYVNRADLPTAQRVYEDFEHVGVEHVEWDEPPDDPDEAA